jgi:oxygen-independent coproporphyrinogen-3 oxidase
MQAAIPGNLQMLERQHNLEDVIRAVSWARQAGFENINLDLIFGIPYQSLQNWEQTLRMALSLLPEHLFLYSLTLEHGTPLWAWVNRGLVLSPDDDLAADMYELAGELLDKSGYIQYEISNWGKRDEQGNLLACQHNLQYWRGDSIPWIWSRCTWVCKPNTHC